MLCVTNNTLNNAITLFQSEQHSSAKIDTDYEWAITFPVAGAYFVIK
ncbi:hypothetical protein VTH8203_00730 [Vibrio thalassae]|uniref:Uncharacterized protein n=1 Tax=Vibrio thalassae TaxID=1243014 RepID=A0A240EG27_9VIBR|nr:hypothetical protein VTH8203_00730 [Vibrio thalassae]